jgi:hypothetical protein
MQPTKEKGFYATLCYRFTGMGDIPIQVGTHRQAP